jgi:hypothetical protein
MRKFVRLSLAALLSAAASAPAGAAEKTLSVSGPGCEYKVRFDPAKFDQKKLRDTAELLLGEGLSMPYFPVHPATEFYTEKMIEADYATCVKPAADLKALSFLDMSGVEDIRARRLEQIADACAFERIKARAMLPGASANILAEFQPAAQACGRLVEKLDDPAGIRPVWRDLVAKACATNASPARCRKDGLAAETKPDGDRLIRADMIGYHWTNCAVDFLKLNVEQPKDEAAQQALAKEFRKRFKVKEICEEG